MRRGLRSYVGGGTDRVRPSTAPFAVSDLKTESSQEGCGPPNAFFPHSNLTVPIYIYVYCVYRLANHKNSGPPSSITQEISQWIRGVHLLVK